MRRRSKTVASQTAAMLMYCAEREGISNAEFSRLVRIPLAEVLNPTARLGFAAHLRVIEFAASLDLFGSAHKLRDTDPTVFTRAIPFLAIALLNAPSGRSAVERFLEYRSLLGEFGRVTADRNGTVLRLEYRPDEPARFAPALGFGHVHLVTALLRQHAASPAAVGLVGPRPWSRERAARQDLLSARISYEQAVSWIEIPAAGPDAPNPHYSAVADRIAMDELGRSLRDLERGASLALATERILRRIVLDGRTTEHALIQQVCEELQVSRWTLRRRLAGEGTTPRAVIASARIEHARRLLSGTDQPIASISATVGFEKQGSFSRFFKAATGMSPNEYRHDKGHS